MPDWFAHKRKSSIGFDQGAPSRWNFRFVIELVGDDEEKQIGAAIAQQSSPPISSEKIAQIVTSSDRTVADRANDVRRKPEQTLGFIGIHSPYRRGRSQPGRRNVANEALQTIVAAASIHSHSRGGHHEG